MQVLRDKGHVGCLHLRDHSYAADNLSIFFILVINVNTAAQTIQQDYDSIEIYLKDDVTKEQANDIIMQVKEEKGVEAAYYKSKEAAMENFRNRWGDNAYLLDSLNENPLPNSVVVMIGDLNYGDQIAKACSQYDGVEDVKYYKDTVDKLLKMTHFVQLAAIIVMIFLIIVSIVVVSNTIKLTVFNRASEISIMKYVGATNWFIREAVPGRGHYYRNHICRHIRRDIGTAVSEDHRCDRSTGIFGVINADEYR